MKFRLNDIIGCACYGRKLTCSIGYCRVTGYYPKSADQEKPGYTTIAGEDAHEIVAADQARLVNRCAMIANEGAV